MRALRGAADRARTEQPGIMSWHCFSAGPHYDPDNISFGPIVGVDEHLVAPGAGFDWHGHRGVHIVSWVLEGTLRHEDDGESVRFVAPGDLLVQLTGAGIRHRETNASDTEPLRFVQTTLFAGDDSPPRVGIERPPLRVAGAEVAVLRASAIIGGSHNAHVLVTRGEFVDGDVDRMAAGDSIRVDDGDSTFLDGEGELLVVSFGP